MLRKQALRIAASLPQGDKTRRQILAALSDRTAKDVLSESPEGLIGGFLWGLAEEAGKYNPWQVPVRPSMIQGGAKVGGKFDSEGTGEKGLSWEVLFKLGKNVILVEAHAGKLRYKNGFPFGYRGGEIMTKVNEWMDSTSSTYWARSY